MTCDLICNRSTDQYPLNGKNRLHILNNREVYYYYYYYTAENEKLTETKQSKYIIGVGLCLYLVKHTLPEIGNATRELSNQSKSAGETYYTHMLSLIK